MNLIEGAAYSKEDFTLNPLAKAEYDNCMFTGCNFANADIIGIIFTECTFTDCNLSNANLKGAAFKEVDFKNCKMLGLNFSVCDPFLMTLQFTECQLNLASFYNLKLKNTKFGKSSLREADLTQVDFTNASFAGCDLSGAVFDNTILEKADLRNALHYSIDPERNRIKGAKFSMPDVKGLLDKYKIDIY